MVKVIGFICECNPYHLGHKRLIDYAKSKGDIVVACMSGDFVQRGEMAVEDKYERAKKLLKNGVDMVIELPVEYVLSSAKYFARMGVSLLNSLGFIDELVFGSESGDIDKLEKIANINIDNDNKIKNTLKDGKSYPEAIEKAYGIKLKSNDILAVEYIRAIHDLKSKMKYSCIKRKTDLPTATELRKKIKNKIDIDKLSDILNYIIFSNTNYDNINLVTKELSNAIQNTKYENLSFSLRADLLNAKNRTLANIKRVFLNIILGIDKDLIKESKSGLKPRYVRILGIKKQSLSLIKKIKCPYLLSFTPNSFRDFKKKFPKVKARSIEKNVYASNLYNLVSNKGKTEAERKVLIV